MKKLILMRGLPSSGKSFTANSLAGTTGKVFSTDEYFYKMIGKDPTVYTFNPRFLADAHKWNLLRTRRAIDEMAQNGSPSPVIVDNTLTQPWEGYNYVIYAQAYEIEVEIAEPTSDWWQEIRLLLYDKRSNKATLKEFAKELAKKNTHNVPFFSIEKMMWRWQNDLTVADIIASGGVKS